jgi:hypothetical protein
VGGGWTWMRTGLIALLGGVLLATSPPDVWGAGPVVSGTCRLAWDAVAEARVARYRLYVSRQPGAHVFGKPAAEFPATTRAVDCARLKLSRPGQYYAVVTAVDQDGHESLPSNELSFAWNPPKRRTPRKAPSPSG